MKIVGIGTRVLNFCIDIILICLLYFLISQWYDFHVMYWNYKPLPSYIIFPVAFFVYYFFFESIFKRTPGKWLTISKVVATNYSKPSIWQIFIRTITRLIVIDCFFVPFFNGRTLHDYLSKTYVVES